MRETKIELNQRKIRKGIRMSKQAQKQQIWEKLSTEYAPAPLNEPIITYKLTRTPGQNAWYYPIA